MGRRSFSGNESTTFHDDRPRFGRRELRTWRQVESKRHKGSLWQSHAGNCNGRDPTAISEHRNTHRKSHAQDIRRGQSLSSGSLDLTEIDIEHLFGFPLGELLQEDWRLQQDHNVESRGQAIGRAACAQGIEALLVPSAADKEGKNIVLFLEVLRAGSEIAAEGVQ